MKKIIGVIPSRYKSTRFPGKPLVDIFGKPMIYWVARQVALSSELSGFMVATDDERIAKVCKDYGIKAVMTSEKHINGTERVEEIAKNGDADVYINIQGDEPMVSPVTIDMVASLFKRDAKIEYAQAAKKIEVPSEFNDDTVVKIAVSKDNYALYLSRSPIPYPRKQENFESYKHIGVYGYTADFLKQFVSWPESRLESIEGIEQLRALENGRKLRIVIVPDDTISIDTSADLRRLINEHETFFKK